MKRHKPKTYRMKRGFFLWPKWEEFKSTSDYNALDWASGCIESGMNSFQHRKVTVQKLVDGKWVNV